MERLKGQGKGKGMQRVNTMEWMKGMVNGKGEWMERNGGHSALIN